LSCKVTSAAKTGVKGAVVATHAAARVRIQRDKPAF
jgi:hypothetical protein